MLQYFSLLLHQRSVVRLSVSLLTIEMLSELPVLISSQPLSNYHSTWQITHLQGAVVVTLVTSIIPTCPDRQQTNPFLPSFLTAGSDTLSTASFDNLIPAEEVEYLATILQAMYENTF